MITEGKVIRNEIDCMYISIDIPQGYGNNVYVDMNKCVWKNMPKGKYIDKIYIDTVTFDNKTETSLSVDISYVGYGYLGPRRNYADINKSTTRWINGSRILGIFDMLYDRTNSIVFKVEYVDENVTSLTKEITLDVHDYHCMPDPYTCPIREEFGVPLENVEVVFILPSKVKYRDGSIEKINELSVSSLGGILENRHVIFTHEYDTDNIKDAKMLLIYGDTVDKLREINEVTYKIVMRIITPDEKKSKEQEEKLLESFVKYPFEKEIVCVGSTLEAYHKWCMDLMKLAPDPSTMPRYFESLYKNNDMNRGINFASSFIQRTVLDKTGDNEMEVISSNGIANKLTKDGFTLIDTVVLYHEKNNEIISIWKK